MINNNLCFNNLCFITIHNKAQNDAHSYVSSKSVGDSQNGFVIKHTRCDMSSIPLYIKICFFFYDNYIVTYVCTHRIIGHMMIVMFNLRHKADMDIAEIL